MKIMPVLSLFIVVLALLTVCPIVSAELNLNVNWRWNYGTDLYQGNETSYSIVITNNFSTAVNITSVWVHTPWMEPNSFGVSFVNRILAPSSTYYLNFSGIVPAEAPVGQTNDFACAVRYEYQNTTGDTGIIRAQTVTIREGKSLYIAPHVSWAEVSIIVFIGIVLLLFYYFASNRTIFLERNSNKIPIVLFIEVLLVYLISLYSNFAGFLLNTPWLQGFALTGDEPHYVLFTRGILSGGLNASTVYAGFPRGFGYHVVNSTGWLTHGQLLPSHGLGMPILYSVPYALGSKVVSGVFGMMVFNCVLAAAIILLIYKLVLNLLNNILVSLITAETFAFATLFFPWSTQLFTEILLGFLLLFIVYEVKVSTNKYTWALIGVILGFLPFIKNEMIILSVTTLITLLFLYRDKVESKFLALSCLAALSVYIVFTWLFYGLQNLVFTEFVSTMGQLPTMAPTMGFLPISRYFWLGLLGLWIDSNSGILWYAPILILSFLGVLSFVEENKPFSLLVLEVFGICYLGTGLLPDWNGWLSIPGRLLICVLPLLALPFAYSISRFAKYRLYRFSYAILFLLSLISNTAIALNRILGYTILWVDNVLTSWYMISLAWDLKINILPYSPDFAYVWTNPGFPYGWTKVIADSNPSMPVIVALWSILFFVAVPLLLYLGRRRKVDG